MWSSPIPLEWVPKGPEMVLIEHENTRYVALRNPKEAQMKVCSAEASDGTERRGFAMM